MLRGLIIASAVCAALTAAPCAWAAGESDAAAAETLFQDGRKLVDAKRYGEACPKFAASQKLAPAIGTLLNLADCYEKNNQLASAWARFHEAITLAQRLGRSNREQTARDRADKLEPRLIKLAILAHASGLEIKLDGNTIEPGALSSPIPVDPGKHTVEATAKGKKAFSKEIEVSDKSKTPSVDIPPLEDDVKDPKEKDPKEKDPKEKDPKEKTTEPPKEKRAWSTQKTVGLVVAGAGVIGLGVGGFFGLRTSSKWKEAQTHCVDLVCDPDGVDLAASAKSSGNIATIGIIAGGALLAGGAVIFFTAADGKIGAPKTAIRAAVGPGSIVVGGSF